MGGWAVRGPRKEIYDGEDRLIAIEWNSGFSIAGSEDSPPLLSVDGFGRWDETGFHGWGSATMLVGRAAGHVLFTGSLNFSDHDSRLFVTEDEPADGLRIAGRDLEVRWLTFPGDGFEFFGLVHLPAEVGNWRFAHSFYAVGSTLRMPDAEFGPDIPGWFYPSFFDVRSLTADSVTITYDDARDELRVGADLLLTVKARQFGLDMSAGGHVLISNGEVTDLVGTITAKDLEIEPGVFTLSKLELTYDGPSRTVGATVGVQVFKGREIEGTLEFLGGDLNAIGVTADNLNTHLRRGVFLQRLAGRLEHLAKSDPAPLAFEGGVSLTYGREMTFDVPALLGGGSYTASVGRFDLDGRISKESVSGTGAVSLLGGAATATATVTFDPRDWSFQATADTNILGRRFGSHGIVVGDGDGEIVGAGTGPITVPNGLPIVGGWSIGTGQVSFENRYFEFRGQLSLPEFLGLNSPFGFRINSDGTFNRLGGVDLPRGGPGAPDLPARDDGPVAASGAFHVPAGQPYILLAATWTGPGRGSLPVELVSPDGGRYTYAELTSGGGLAAVVPSLSGSTQVTVAVKAPAAGTWTLVVPDSTGLNGLRFDAIGATATPSVSVTAPAQVVGGGGRVVVAYDAQAATPGAVTTVSLYYDRVGLGHGGVRIASGLPTGAGTFEWDTSTLPAGDYFVYARVADDAGAMPALAYAPGRVRVSVGPPVVRSLWAPAAGGGTLTRAWLTAVATGDGGAGEVASVRFFREQNGVAGLQTGGGAPDLLLGAGTRRADGTWTIDLSTTGLEPGAYTYYAAATDAAGLVSPSGAAATSLRYDVFMPGDVDGNRIVTLNDLVILANNYGKSSGATWAEGDIDGNGAVALNDLVILANMYGTRLPEPVADLPAEPVVPPNGATDEARPGTPAVPEQVVTPAVLEPPPDAIAGTIDAVSPAPVPEPVPSTVTPTAIPEPVPPTVTTTEPSTVTPTTAATVDSPESITGGAVAESSPTSPPTPMPMPMPPPKPPGDAPNRASSFAAGPAIRFGRRGPRVADGDSPSRAEVHAAVASPKVPSGAGRESQTRPGASPAFASVTRPPMGDPADKEERASVAGTLFSDARVGGPAVPQSRRIGSRGS